MNFITVYTSSKKVLQLFFLCKFVYVNIGKISAEKAQVFLPFTEGSLALLPAIGSIEVLFA